MKFALLYAKYFNHFSSSPPFDACSSRNPDELAKELGDALTDIYTISTVTPIVTPTRDAERRDAERRDAECRDTECQDAERQVAECRDEELQDAECRDAECQDAGRRDAERGDATHILQIVDKTQEVEKEEGAVAACSSTMAETPVSTNHLKKGKKRLVFSSDQVSRQSKKQKSDDLQSSCDDCLVSGKQVTFKI